MVEEAAQLVVLSVVDVVVAAVMAEALPEEVF